MVIHVNVLLYNSVRSLTQLEELDVSYSWVLTLPDWLGDITSLKVLNIRDCDMTTIPDW